MDNEQAVYLWHIPAGREVLTLTQPRAVVNWVTFSPDGTHLLAGLHDGTIRIWHAPAVPR